MLPFVLIASLLFSDVKEGEAPATKEIRRAAFALLQQGKFAEALPDLRVAAKRGDRLALYQLGILYEIGKVVPQSYEKAWNCFSKAADQGLLIANHKLGLFYFYGWYVPQSEEKAKQYWLKGASKGFAPSEYLWATTVLSLKTSDNTSDNVQAIRWLIKAARQNLPEAVALLGVMYEVGFGVKKDLPLAYTLEERSAEAKFEIEPNMKSLTRSVMERIKENYPGDFSLSFSGLPWASLTCARTLPLLRHARQVFRDGE